ncbi:UDP-glucose 4-epimerase GalE [Prosthecodimorpha staleyi]|uniref:UDP-glucose 4-epimerase n=1 Tax=Prosthecodimorpha staleyi TaxID=2840188 RepID=A0A947D4B3_9HYPH|nr:UDP-glucose 4-epimerase GalE [Prosthecodimorpha staleyi]MBT9290078.1 UDP-glucose 4-epimerase GalE [Prosthecodimorpha staleyi]
MTVLVTGGAGYIGSHMVWELVDRDEPVVVLDRLSTGFRWAVAPEAAFVEGDIGDEALLDDVIARFGVDAIIHFAGSVVVPDSVADPLGYYLNNTVKSRAVIAAAVRNGVRHFVFSSTSAVYGDPPTIPVGEDAPLKPLSPYGTSKLMTELMLADVAAAHDFRYAALRYFNVAGADPKGRTGQSTRGATHLIKVAVETALGDRPEIQVFGTDYDTPDGTGVRDYIHVADLIDAHVRALDHLRAGNPSLIANCGYERGFSVLEVLKAVERVAGLSLPVRIAPRRPGDSPKVVARSERVRQVLGWAPRWDDLDTIVGHALAWERSRRRRNDLR